MTKGTPKNNGTGGGRRANQGRGGCKNTQKTGKGKGTGRGTGRGKGK